ncbi:SRPBCC family protein [Streptomyces sp. TLI_171]|uniref:SRPBCC family protein n=1 Tax=Streptomyces sp. TLI_171 TaxID=1938859 RepID=UPI000C1992AE|nr:SRPBCC family protein [Streptomyces sp. TLI_171]RKE17533.1 putative membrane protein [Streptomyces sp. TLI_171]
MARSSEDGRSGQGGVLEALPTERLMEQARELMSALGDHAVELASDKVGAVTERLVGFVADGGSGDGGGGGKTSIAKAVLGAGASGVKQAVTGAFSRGGGSGKGGKGGGKDTKVTNIVEQIDVGVPVRVAYNQWTQFQDFPKYTKKLENVDQSEDQKLTWKAGIFLSHRTWESTIVEQVPDELIAWRSKGEKGSADGTVTFHELAPNLTRILLVIEYHPQGLFERTGNLWRAQGRRVRLELKHFRRHVMTRTVLDPDSVEGWRGEIRDGEVVRSHEDALEEEQQEQEPEDGEDQEQPDDEEGDYEDEEPDEDEESDEDTGDDEYAEDEPEDDEEYDDDAYEDEDEDDADDAYDDEPASDEEEPAERGSRRTPARKR